MPIQARMGLANPQAAATFAAHIHPLVVPADLAAEPCLVRLRAVQMEVLMDQGQHEGRMELACFAKVLLDQGQEGECMGVD